jgi:uncharacterized radical SAM superfamily Fe-S cluster-containing enzyme
MNTGMAPMTNILKKTESVCPECLAVLDAEVYEDHGQVWITKECPAHGRTRGLVEKDALFYAKTMNRQRVEFRPPSHVMVAVTHRCNLHCTFCFVPNRERGDLSMEEIEARTAGLPPFILCFTGGEPTLRDDLFEMIARGRALPNVVQVFLITNGLRLAEPGYVEELQRAGLTAVLFSLNGFSDDVYRKMNGRPLLEMKLRVLENLSRSTIYTALSPTLMRGLNEDDLGKMLDFILERGAPFWQLRVRTAANVGTHPATDSLCTSELLDLVGRYFGVSRDYFVKTFDPRRCYHSPYQFNLRLLVECGNRRKQILRWDHGAFSLGHPPEMPQVPNARPILINLWGWPDRYNIDLNDVQATGVKHMTHDGRILDFYEAITRPEEL